MLQYKERLFSLNFVLFYLSLHHNNLSLIIVFRSAISKSFHLNNVAFDVFLCVLLFLSIVTLQC